MSLPPALPGTRIDSLALSDAATLVTLNVARDARFQTLGFLIDSLDAMLVFLESHRFLAGVLAHPSVAAVITTPELAGDCAALAGVALSPTPKRTFFELQNALVAASLLYAHAAESDVHPGASIHPRAWLAEKGVIIADGVTVSPNCAVHEGCTIGARATIRSGAVLGGAGFQTCRDSAGLIELAHGGGIEIAEDAIVFENAVVARGVFRQSTRIGAQSRVGAGAFVSHNVQIGARVHIGHGAIVNGNVRIGDDVWVGPGAVISNNLSIGCDARVSLGSVVASDVAPGEHVSGNFARPHREFLRGLGSAKR